MHQSKQITANQPGTTLVSFAAHGELIAMLSAWNEVPDFAKALAPLNESDQSIGLWIANEFIDWAYYRTEEKFSHKSGYLTRSTELPTIRGKLLGPKERPPIVFDEG